MFPTIVGFKLPMWYHGNTPWADSWLSYSSFSSFLSLKKKPDSTVFKIYHCPHFHKCWRDCTSQHPPPHVHPLPLSNNCKAVGPPRGLWPPRLPPRVGPRGHPADEYPDSRTPFPGLLHVTRSGATVLVWVPQKQSLRSGFGCSLFGRGCQEAPVGK